MIGKYPHTKEIRQGRRARAEAVQARNAHLTPEERRANLDELGLRALKERAKLARKIKAAAEEAASNKKNKKS